jgi:hypothetical protein
MSGEFFRKAYEHRLALGLLAALCYFTYHQYHTVTRICENLAIAFDITASGSQGEFSLGFEQTVDLFERLPNVRQASRICQTARPNAPYSITEILP